MKKEEILELSREENATGDEREKMIKRKGKRLATGVSYILFIIIIFLNQYYNRSVTILTVISDIITLSFIASFCFHIYRYTVDRNKEDLIVGSVDFFLALLSIIEFIKKII